MKKAFIVEEKQLTRCIRPAVANTQPSRSTNRPAPSLRRVGVCKQEGETVETAELRVTETPVKLLKHVETNSRVEELEFGH